MHSRLTRAVRPRLEGKPRTPLSSRVATRVSWCPLSGLKGVQPPLQFGERTRDCSPGHAGKEGPHLVMTGVSGGISGAASRVATRISWSPLSGFKGVQPPLQFGERTRDCSPGQAGKEGPQLARTGASQGFPRAAAPVGVFSQGTTRISGASRAAPGKPGLHGRGEGERVFAL